VPRWKLCYRRIQDPRNFAMVWVQELLQEQKAVFGPDPWPYNLEDNRKALEAVVRYEFEQGMIRKQPAIEDLFFPPSLQQIQQYLMAGFGPEADIADRSLEIGHGRYWKSASDRKG